MKPRKIDQIVTRKRSDGTQVVVDVFRTFRVEPGEAYHVVRNKQREFRTEGGREALELNGMLVTDDGEVLIPDDKAQLMAHL